MYEAHRVEFVAAVADDLELRVCKQCWPEGHEVPTSDFTIPVLAMDVDDASVDSQDESSSTDSAVTTDVEAE